MYFQQVSMVARSVQLSTLRLQLSRPLRGGEAPALRGFFGRQFEDEILMHNHGPNDELIYQYPRIQFKVLDRYAYVIGLNEGGELLQSLWLGIDQTRIGDDELEVLQADLRVETAAIEFVESPIPYRFATPWLALNQKNFQEHTQLSQESERREKLERTLVGNCLSACKSLGIRLNDRIIADCSRLRSFKTTLKGQTMLSFTGAFSLNLSLPDHIGLGKSVSRGFGTIERKSR